MTYTGPDRRKDTGRRECDGVCPVHDEVRGSDLACFKEIKSKMRELETRMDKFVSKWLIGIITTVSMGAIVIIVGLSGSKMKDIHQDVKDLVFSMSDLKTRSNNIMIKQGKLSTVQEYILRDILQIKKSLEEHDRGDNERSGRIGTPDIGG